MSWNVYFPHFNKSYSKFYAYTGVRDPVSFEIDSMVNLSFDRISESGVLPLISQLSITNVAAHLNGTMINCTEHSLELDSNIILQTVVSIINTRVRKFIRRYM